MLARGRMDGEQKHCREAVSPKKLCRVGWSRVHVRACTAAGRQAHRYTQTDISRSHLVPDLFTSAERRHGKHSSRRVHAAVARAETPCSVARATTLSFAMNCGPPEEPLGSRALEAALVPATLLFRVQEGVQCGYIYTDQDGRFLFTWPKPPLIEVAKTLQYAFKCYNRLPRPLRSVVENRDPVQLKAHFVQRGGD